MPDPVAHSVHDRLLAIAKQRKEDFNALLSQYANERLLYRLSRTPHGKRFVLKGASLFLLWFGQYHRPTRDLDLLGFGELSPASLKMLFQNVCAVKVRDDGIQFLPSSITISNIREDQEYLGQRIKLRGHLGTARLSLQIDVGIGDAITPGPEQVDFPTLLDMPAPNLRAYPRETTIAEKLDAILDLGIKNTRMKDYFDLWMLVQNFSFEGRALQNALQATLNRRGRQRPSPYPVGLSDEFASDITKVRQWNAFIRRSRSLQATSDLMKIIVNLRAFAGPLIAAVANGTPFGGHWKPSGPWQSAK